MFSTRRTAQAAPRLLFEEMRIQIAVGILVAILAVPVEVAQERLRDAAISAGIDETAMTNIVIAQAVFSAAPSDELDDPPGGYYFEG